MYVSGAHNAAVTCLEWCPDGELLYSGDIHGKVYVTVVKFQEVPCKSQSSPKVLRTPLPQDNELNSDHVFKVL